MKITNNHSHISYMDFAYAQVQNEKAKNGITAENSVLPSIFLMVGIFVVFYVLTVLPQKKKQKELEKQIQSMKKGDTVLTTGGIYAEIMQIKDDHIIAKLDDVNTKVKIIKWAITSVIKK